MKTHLCFHLFPQIVTEPEMMKEVNSSPRRAGQMDSTRNSLKCHGKGWQCVCESLSLPFGLPGLKGGLGAVMDRRSSPLPGTSKLNACRRTALLTPAARTRLHSDQVGAGRGQ